MKILIAILLFLSSIFAFSQQNMKPELSVDTVAFYCKIKDVIDITSLVPQISGDINVDIKNKINKDIKSYFQASKYTIDSAQFVEDLLLDFGANSLEEYIQMKEEISEGNPDFEFDITTEIFEIPYLSENLFIININTTIDPYLAKELFFFESIVYDLKTGNKLNFNDFFSINKEQLVKELKKGGYFHDAGDKLYFNSSEYAKIIFSELKENMQRLNDSNQECINFYFEIEDEKLELKLKLKCAGPQFMEVGIAVESILKYVKYHEFKNKYKLWGKTIFALKGKEFPVLVDQLEFQDYTVNNNGSGFMLNRDSNFQNTDFGITICHSTTSVFYVFLKFEIKNGSKTARVLDILEIKKTDIMANFSFTEYCHTATGADTEILALVEETTANTEYYTKIIKAWRANRKTEKIEMMDIKKVVKCSRELEN